MSLTQEKPGPQTKLIPVGTRFGRLVVLGYAGRKGKTASWLCRCDCGTEKAMLGISLRFGETVSCGCYHSEQAADHCKRAMGPGNRRGVGEAARDRAVWARQSLAGRRGIPWTISHAEALQLMSGDCYWCGESPKNTRKNPNGNGDFVYNGIDRYENSKGYVPGNCVPCCAVCNRMKNKYSVADFLDKCQRIVSRHIRRSVA